MVADCANLCASEKQNSTNDGEKRKKELRDVIMEHSQSSGDSTSSEIKEPPLTGKKDHDFGRFYGKNIHSWKLRAALRENFIVRSFPGAKTNDMMHYTKPTADQNPDLFIIHSGTTVVPMTSALKRL